MDLFRYLSGVSNRNFNINEYLKTNIMNYKRQKFSELQKIRLNQKMKKKSTAYILWLFFGWAGWHRQYLGNELLGYLQGALTVILGVGLYFSNLIIIMLGCFAVLQWILDLFLLDISVDEYNNEVFYQFICEVEHERLMNIQVDWENVEHVESPAINHINNR